MNKLKETLISVWKAARYSFAFCFRNNKRDTVIVSFLLLLQTILGYGVIVITGNLISAVQAHITRATGPITISDFMRGKFFFPVALVIATLFLEIGLQKYKSYKLSRQRHILRVANLREMNALRGSLDIGRRRSKQFDDVERKIDELPDGWFTRITFAAETIEFTGVLISFIIFGTSLLVSHYGYVFILIAASIPMIFAEFAAVGRMWKLSLEMVPHHKKRNVLQRAFTGTTSFLQGQMFNQMPTLTEQIQDNQDHVIKTLDRMRWLNLQITLSAYMVSMIGLSIVLAHSVFGTLSTRGDIGTLTIIMISARRLQSSIRDIVLQVAAQWQSVKGMIIIEEDYFGMRPLIQTPNPVRPEFEGPPRIRFDEVSFSYPDTDHLVLRDVSFAIEPGSKVVVVGKNGSGKSSLMSLLLRHYDPTSGSIHIGDIDLRNVTPTVWTRYICALLQDFVIMERQVGTEIASSRLDQPIEMEEVREAARFAGFDSVMNKDPKGYEVQIGTEHGGREFSGGEEQRLAMARARYRKTPILILDEPDAKLDPEAAQALLDNIFALKGVTVIIVTQHVSRATRSDKVIVLDQGQIAETGTHEELLARGGRYAKMFRKDKERHAAED